MKRGIKRSMSDAFELPREVVLNLPLISLTGREEAVIENYKGIIEYSQDTVRISTGAGVLKIQGKNLLLKHITDEDVSVTGGILKLEFLI